MLDRRISVAPMMDYTDRHCRYLMRLLSPSALLYTEMVTAQALLRGDAARLLAFDPAEHPVGLQLGGSDPQTLAEAARIGAAAGYDEINLNCGCPSDRVQSGRFGACLMDEPERVAACVAAMRVAVTVPVTVKCRIGIEPSRSALTGYRFLAGFVETVAAAGCSVFVVHARKAILDGLSPKQNREVPPLQYEVVARLKQDFPALGIVLNGGVRRLTEVAAHLETFDGVMIGREAYQNPYLLAELHGAICDPGWRAPTREEVVRAYVPYVQARVAEGHRLTALTRPLHGLYAGRPGARSWRRFLSEQAARPQTPAEFLVDSLRIVREAA
ncbi:MAG TPA: tRNA dihydrouridine(20/20a) synthase DusA [Steroidobacteraceae bacterium]|nr:tRNA dihydrouridine(20/20a) synthase DusA [Steroidobacteraceae bacterium]